MNIDTEKNHTDKYVSQFVKEEKNYTKKELCDIFLLDEKAFDLFSETLLKNGVLRNALNKRTNEYKFTYVGIIIYSNLIIKVYPKYMTLHPTENNKYDMKFRQILNVIEKYKYDSKGTYYLFDDEEYGNEGYLGLLIYLLDDYFENGIYKNEKSIIEINGSGEVDWNKTVNNNNAIIQNNIPYYFELYTNNRTINDHDYFTRLHQCIITQCSKEIKNYGLEELLGIATAEISDEELYDLGDADYIIYMIENESNMQFNTRKHELLDLMKRYIEHHFSNMSGCYLDLYGTRNFHSVWEAVCSKAFKNQLYVPINQLKLPVPLNEDFAGYKNLISIIEKPRWGNILSEQTLRPDVVSFISDDNGMKFVILDAKYYVPIIKDHSISYQPGVEDVTKQYLYNLAFKDFIKTHQFIKTENCFLMPVDENMMYPELEVHMEILEKLGLCAIKVYWIPAQKIFDIYLKDI